MIRLPGRTLNSGHWRHAATSVEIVWPEPGSTGIGRRRHCGSRRPPRPMACRGRPSRPPNRKIPCNTLTCRRNSHTVISYTRYTHVSSRVAEFRRGRWKRAAKSPADRRPYPARRYVRGGRPHALQRKPQVNHVLLRVLRALGMWHGSGRVTDASDTHSQRAEDSGRGQSPLFGVLIPIESRGRRRD